MDLKLSTRIVDGATVATVSGEIDVYSAPALREQLSALMTSASPRLVVDLNGVGFLDSTGLGVLVGIHKRARALDGKLALVCSQPRLLKILTITGLASVFGIHPGVDEALVEVRA